MTSRKVGTKVEGGLVSTLYGVDKTLVEIRFYLPIETPALTAERIAAEACAQIEDAEDATYRISALTVPVSEPEE